MDLPGALMLKLRGRRPYLILASCLDKPALAKRQKYRKSVRNTANEQRLSLVTPLERSTLQVLLSGRIIITGIINEILLYLPEDKEQSEFVVDSECSLMMDSEARQAVRDYAKGVNLLTLLASSSTSLEVCKRAHERSSQMEPSLYSLYKESQCTGEYNSYVNGQSSYQDKKSKKSEVQQRKSKEGKYPSLSRPKSVDFSRYASSTWKGLSMVPDSSKSSKSVTFTSTDAENQEIDPVGLLIEPQPPAQSEQDDKAKAMRSISMRMRWPTRGPTNPNESVEDLDLWLAFLTETGIMRASDITTQRSDPFSGNDGKLDDPDSLIRQMDYYNNATCETLTTNVRDDYEGIHRKLPGLFRDTVTMDNADAAFNKVKNFIRDVVNTQSSFKPMFDIDFVNLKYYPTVERRLSNICKQVAPQRLFY